MNEELTREVLEVIKRCSETSCSECPAVGVCCSEDDITIGQRLAAALLAEMDKPKVWDGAPLQSSRAAVTFYGNGKRCGIREHTRELPKTRTREIAEEVTALVNRAIDGISVKEIEALLNKYAEELTKKEAQ